MINNEYEYPRVVQIMPCHNIWLQYECPVNKFIFYDRAHCLALVEVKDIKNIISSDVRYVDIDSSGVFDLEPGYIGVFCCDKDLSSLTHAITDERHPLLISMGIGEASTEPA